MTGKDRAPRASLGDRLASWGPRLILTLLLGLCSLADARVVCAQARQSAAAPSAAYEAAVKLGFEEFQLGNYVEARARFSEAHKLYPNARTLRALGMVEYELKRYVEAIGYLENALASTERALTDEQRAQSERLLEQARGYVAHYRFALTPANASVSVDGAPWRGEASRGLLLAAGEHVIEVSAPGHESTRRSVQVLGGEGERELAIMLLAQRVESAQSPPVEERAAGRARKAWIWGTVGAVLLGGAVAGLVLGLRAKRQDAHVNAGTTGLEIPVPRDMALEWR